MRHGFFYCDVDLDGVRSGQRPAVAEILNALSGKPDFPQAIAMRVALLIELNRVQEASTILPPALQSHPESAELLNSAGLLALRQINLKQAEEFFLQSITLKSDYTDALVNHAISLTLLKRSTEAIPQFNQALQTQPKNLKAQANLAQALFDLHHYPEAADAFSRAIELSPDDPDLHTNLGLALQKAGHPEEAKKAFADAQKLRASSTKSNPKSNI